MATSYGTIIGHPDYAKLSPEKKQSIAQQYWKDDPLAADAIALTQTAPDDLSSIQQKAFDDRRKISALRIAAREPEAAQYAEQIDAGIQETEDNLARLSSIYTPEAQNDINALVEPARNTGLFGSLPLENQLGRVGVGFSPEEYQEVYNSQRDATAQRYGLTTEQLDDVVRHQMDAQEKLVSRDALGRVHIKNNVFIEGLDSVKKGVENSDLPASVKAQELEGIDERYQGFQEAVVANTLQNHKDYAKEIGLDASKPVEENFKKIGESLNTGRFENEFSAAVQATRQGGAALLRGLGTVAEAISPEAAGESGLRRTADQLDQRQKIFESQLALSNEFNNDKLSIFGLTPGAIGQGVGSVAESAVIARATGGLIPRIGGAGALSGYLNSIRGVAPTAAIIGTRTGLQTYDDAIKQGLSEEDATRAGLASGIIEAGTTLAFTAAGAGGIEDIASGMKKTVGPAVKSAFGAATKDVAKNTLGEVTEESIINALDQALVQTTVQPGMTTEQFLQSVKDTAVATLIAGGPITAASGVATYQQTNEQLRQRANQIAKENLPEIETTGGTVTQTSTPSLAEERAAVTGDEIDGQSSLNANLPEAVVEESTVEDQQVPVLEQTVISPETSPEIVTENVETVNEQETQNQNTEEVVSTDGGLEPERLEDTSRELETATLNETTPNPPTPAGAGMAETVAAGETPQATSTTTPVESPVIRATNASIDRDLERLNQEPIARQARQQLGTIWDEAVTEARAEPLKASRLVTELAGTRIGADGNFVGGKPRSVTAKEQGIILYEYAQRKVRAEKTRAEINNTTDPVIAQTLQEKLQLDLSDMRQAAVANRIAGAEAGRALRFRQVGIDAESYGLVSMQNRYQSEINNGQKLSKQQEAEVRELNNRILSTEEEVVAAQEEAYARGRVDAEREFLAKAKKSLPKNKKSSAEKVADLTRKAREARQRLNDRFKRRIEGGQAFSGGITEEDVVDVAIIATSYIRAGAVALADFTTRLVKEFGETARPFADRIFAEANAMLNGIVKTPEQLVAEMDPTKPINRQSVNSMVRSYLEENIKLSAQDVVTKLQSDLKEKWPDITREQASDAWTGYGQESITPQTRSEVQRAANDLRRAALLQRQIDDLKVGNYNKKTRTPTQANEEITRLTNERNELLKSAKVPVPRDPVATAKARIRKQIENLQQAVASNQLIPSRTSQTDAELDALRAELKTAQDAYNEAFPEQGTQLTPNQEEDRAVKALDKQIEALEKQEFEAAKKQDFNWFSPEISERRKRLNDLREARNEIRWQENSAKTTQRAIDALEDILATGNLPETSKRKPKYTPDQRLKALLDEKNQLQKRVTELRKQRGLEDAQYKAAEKSLHDYERRIRERDFEQKPRAQAVSERVKEIRAQRDAAQKQFTQMRRENESEAERESRQVRALERSREDYEQRIRDGNFTKEPRQTREESKRIRDARLANAKAKEEWDRKFFEQQLKNQTKVQKALRILVEPINLSRTIITSLDLPPIFRQGMLVTLTRPSIALKNFPKAVVAGVSPARALEVEENIRNHPEYNLAKTAKLSLTESGPYASLSQQEEEFRGRWAKKIPGVNIITNFSERNYTTYLNSLRMDLFSTMVKSLSVTGNPTVAEAKLIANYVNNATGRGDLGKLEGSMSLLSALFFSPRYWASRINSVLGVFPVIFDVTTGFQFREADVVRARKAIAKEYARALIGYGLLYGSLLYGAAGLLDDEDELKIEWDSRSSDFGKIRIGKARFDPLAGMASNIVFVSRFLSKSSKNIKTGQVTEKDGDGFIGLVTTYVRGKLAPLPGAVINYQSEKDIVGNRTTARTELVGLFLPLSPQDIYEQFKEFGPAGGIGTAFATLMGLGTQIHDDGLTPKQQIAIALGDNPADLKPKPRKSKSRFNLR